MTVTSPTRAALLVCVAQTLDDSAVAALAAEASLVIAHNAGFDPRFLERRFPVFVDTTWRRDKVLSVLWSEHGAFAVPCFVRGAWDDEALAL